MRRDTESLLTIGQFAAMHHINKKTLMWYDQVGLFQPAVIGENGYRYYTWYQSSALETILMLREMDVPIPEIQRFMKNRSAQALEALLGQSLCQLDRTLLRLRSIREKLAGCQADMRTLMDTDLSEICVVEERRPRWLAAVPTSADATFEQEAAMILDEAARHQLDRLYHASYGAMLPVEQLYAGAFDAYACLFIEIGAPVSTEGLHLRPPGLYLRAFCKGNWNKLPETYAEILRCAGERGLRLHGFAYEEGINEAVIDSADDYITQIEIPVTRLDAGI